MQPCIVVLAAPSGSGKTTLARQLLERIPRLRFSISATTRAPRRGEIDGEHYHFLSEAAFEEAVREDRFLEWEEVYPGCRYGTLRSEVDRSRTSDPVLLDIDVKGAVNVKKQYGGRAFTIFLKAPSLAELRARLQNRETESQESLQLRLETAKKELAYESRFDVVVVNDDLKYASDRLNSIVLDFLARC